MINNQYSIINKQYSMINNQMFNQIVQATEESVTTGCELHSFAIPQLHTFI